MAEDKAVKKAVKSEAPNEKAKDAVKTAPQALAKTGKLKVIKAEAPAETTVKAPESQIVPQAPKAETKEAAKAAPEAQKPEVPVPEAKAEVKAESKEAKKEAKKEADPSKEFVDGIMAEMSLKGASKKRLIRTLAEQYNFDKQKVLFKLRRALISERYAAAHAEGGH